MLNLWTLRHCSRSSRRQWCILVQMHYDKMKVPQACNAPHAWYLQNLLPISSGKILCQQLKQAGARRASTHKRSPYKDDLWCSQQATKFTCLLFHWRRLRREPDKLRQCLQTATGEERERIQALVKIGPGLVQAQSGQRSVRRPSLPPCHCQEQRLNQSPVRRTSLLPQQSPVRRTSLLSQQRLARKPGS